MVSLLSETLGKAVAKILGFSVKGVVMVWMTDEPMGIIRHRPIG